MHQCLMQSGDLGGIEPRQGHQDLGGHRVVLVMHGGGLAAARKHRFADLVLRQQGDVLPDLAETPRDQRQPVAKLRQVVARVLPAEIGNGEIELPAQGSGQGWTAIAELLQRADRPAELQHEHARLQFRQPLPMPLKRCTPSGDPVRPGDRQGALHPGPRHGRLGAILLRHGLQLSIDRIDPLRQECQGGLQTQHQAGVEHVLAGRSEMHMLVMRRADMPAQLLDPVRHHHAVAQRAFRQRLHVWFELRRRLRNGRSGRRRDDAGIALHCSQGNLEVEHGAELRLDVEIPRDRVVAEQGG
jgi:hypothetical protein